MGVLLSKQVSMEAGHLAPENRETPNGISFLSGNTTNFWPKNAGREFAE